MAAAREFRSLGLLDRFGMSPAYAARHRGQAFPKFKLTHYRTGASQFDLRVQGSVYRILWYLLLSYSSSQARELLH